MPPKKSKKTKTVEETLTVPVQPLAVQHVLHNGDLLGIICELLLETWKTYRSTIPTSERIHPLVALAMTNKVISAVALNALWKHLDSLRPIVALFSESTEQSKAEGRPYGSSREPALCEDIPEATWCRFDSYIHRIQCLTFNKSFSPKYLLRFAERRRPIFPNLRKLTVSLELASDPAILFVHAPRTSHIELRFPSTPDKEQTITAISTIAWNLPNIHTLITSLSEDRYYYSEHRPLTFSVTFNKLSSSNLRRLEIAHSVDRAMLLVFSKFQRLEHLTINLCETGAGKEVSFTDTGFTSLTSLKINARVAEMPKIIKIFPNEILRSLEFTDTSESSTDRAASMEEFHALLVTKMSTLQELKLSYGVRKPTATSMLGAFGQLERLAAVRHFSYQGDVALDEDVIRQMIPSWRKTVSLRIWRR